MAAVARRHDRRSLPLGTVVFRVEIETAASGAALCALGTDLSRYTDIEPRIRAARWLDATAPRPRPGAQAEVVGDIPFSFPVFERLVGQPRGTATLEEFEPPRRLAYRLDTPHAVGRLSATFTDNDAGCRASIEGWIIPRRRGRIALAPLTPALAELVEHAVRRAFARAAAEAARRSA